MTITVNITMELKYKVKIYLVNEIILREIFSLMRRLMSVRIMLYSFSTVTEFR